jgi:hypothetical protein
MTDAQLYLLIAPFVLFTVCAGGAYAWIKWSDRELRKSDRARRAK